MIQPIDIEPPQEAEANGKPVHEGHDIFSRTEYFLQIRYEMRYNIISNKVEVLDKTEQGGQWQLLNENNVYIDLQKSGIKMSLNNLVALLRSDFVPKYNPFLEYFEGLKPWSNVMPDYIERLSSYIKIKGTDSDVKDFRAAFKKHIVRTVACAIDDKVYNKQAFILVHEGQNSGKSTFCRYLCPPKLETYFVEEFTVDKDGLIALAENFIINLDELSTLQRAELNTLKSYFSKDKVKVRIPYEKKPVQLPRRCSFVGSTNKVDFLSDETGSVRWLCFELADEPRPIDWAYKDKVNIDDVYAQAYALYKSGFEYQLTLPEILANEQRNMNYRQITAEFDLVQKYIEPCKPDEIGAEFLTTTEIMMFLTMRTNAQIKISTLLIGKALKMSGVLHGQKRRGDIPVKGYWVRLIRDV